MSITYENLSPNLEFGTRVLGLTLQDLDDQNVCKDLRDLWIDRGVIVFSECTPTTELHLKLARCFGEIERHSHRELWADDEGSILKQSSGGSDDILYELDGQPAPTLNPWHSDQVYKESINHGTMMRMLTPTTQGGLTGFIDQISAYTNLPTSLKKEIDGLHVIYKMHVQLERNQYALRGKSIKFIHGSPYFDSMLAREDQDFPPVTHPLVFKEPETGRMVLNLSPMFAVQIAGMPEDKSNKLLNELLDHMLDDSKAYYHRWTTSDFVVWDNWRTIHCATPTPVGEVRTFLRSVIAGDYRLGKKYESAAKAAQ